MTLSKLLEKDTPCEAGLAFIEKWKCHDWALSEVWELIKAENPVFLGWGVKHAPMGPEKLRSLRIIRELGVGQPGKEWMEKDELIALCCFGWMHNPFLEAK